MNGHPTLSLIFVLIAFGLLGYPVWKLTGATRRVLPVEMKEVPVRELSLQVSFASPPQDFKLAYLDRILIQGRAPRSEFTGNLPISLPKEGVDLLLKVKWPMGTARTAVQVRVSNGERILTDKTIWSEKDLVEIITVPDLQGGAE